MKYILIILASIGILLTILPSVMVITGIIDMTSNNLLMGIGMVLWFVSVPIYIGKFGKKEEKV